MVSHKDMAAEGWKAKEPGYKGKGSVEVHTGSRLSMSVFAKSIGIPHSEVWVKPLHFMKDLISTVITPPRTPHKTENSLGFFPLVSTGINVVLS